MLCVVSDYMLTNSIPKILHQTAKTLSWEEHALTKQTRLLMPEWTYTMWSDDGNEAIVKKYFPQYLEDYQNLPSPIVRTDVARCVYMYAFGGVYCDTDFRFYRAIPNDLLSHSCALGVEEGEFLKDGTVGVGDGYKVGNAFMASAPGLQLWADFLDDVFKRFRDGEREVLYLAGPHALSIFLKKNPEHETTVSLLPGHVVYPQFKWGGLTSDCGPETIGIHLCWGSWRKKPLLQKIKNRSRRIGSAMLAIFPLDILALKAQSQSHVSTQAVAAKKIAG